MGSHDVPSTMRALVKRCEQESYRLEDMVTPQPKDDEVLIQMEAASICGSDIALYQWNDVARQIASLPFTPGHEGAGVVVQTGPEATLKLGDRVAVENHFYCGECYQCLHDRGDICQQMGQYGHGKKTIHGACAQFSIVRSKYCYKLTSDISYEEAALLEPLGVAHNALERLKVSGEAVLIIGGGTIGILACAVAKNLGATRVLIADPHDNRLAVAIEMGADRAVNVTREDLPAVIQEETQGDGIGRICEMSGCPEQVNSQFSMLRKGGRVVLVGLPKKPLHVPNVLPDVVFKCLTIKSIHGRRIFHTWRESERLVAEGHVDLQKVITHRFPMTQFEEAFSTLFQKRGIKIVMDPSM